MGTIVRRNLALTCLLSLIVKVASWSIVGAPGWKQEKVKAKALGRSLWREP
jgi:hypothetical protein